MRRKVSQQTVLPRSDLKKTNGKEEPVTRSLLLFVSALVFAACPAMASTYYVGRCHEGESFPTISAAVSAVPAGSIVNLCPGFYSEQVIISKSLTLQGIAYQNTSGAAVESSGSVAETQVLGLELIPAIWVTAGTVNISNLSVVSYSVPTCPQLPTGIFYASGTSGTVNHVSVAAGNNACGEGAGIVAENATAHSSSIKIENNYIDTDNFGLIMGSQQPEGVLPVLLNTITGNTITAQTHGMLLLQSRGTISANNITGSNPKDDTSYGILDAAPATTITHNSIVGTYTGIAINGASATVTGNRIDVSTTGIDLGCTLGTVTGNTILANIGLDHTPATFTGKNIFMLTPEMISGGC
jgi:Periplasmic copper-binding protein (NosD)